LGIALTMDLGTFPWVMIATFALLLSTEDWDALRTAMSRLSLSVQWPRERIQQGATDVRGPTAWGWVATALVAFAFVAISIDAYNINLARDWGRRPIGEPEVFRRFIRVTQLVQNWNLFAPDPMKDDGWWVVEGETMSGALIDPLNGGRPTFAKPAHFSQRMGAHWRKYLHRVSREYPNLRPALARYFCRAQAHRSPDDSFERVRVFFVREWTQPPGIAPPFSTETILLSDERCRRSPEPAARSARRLDQHD
jgi:hypothetical protein